MENHPSECYKGNPRGVRLAQESLISLLNLSERNGANEVTQRILKRCKTFRQKKNPYLVQKTNGWHSDKEKDKQVQDFIIIGYAPTRADGLQMLQTIIKIHLIRRLRR